MTPDRGSRRLAHVACALYATVKEAGDRGAPSGIMYAAVMAHDIRLDQYQLIMGVLEQGGLIKRRGNVYYAVK